MNDADTAHIVQLYESGMSPEQIAQQLGIGRTTVRRRLAAAGTATRGRAEMNRITPVRRSPEGRQRIIDALVARVKGTPRTETALGKQAATRQQRLTNRSAAEDRFAELLAKRGLIVVPQVAVGRYNCDLAAYPVAVEVLGGNWHQRRAPFHAQRGNYILDRGWHLLYAWDTDRDPLGGDAADYVVAFVEQTRSNPASRGQYRVIGGGGQELARGEGQLDQGAFVAPRRAARRLDS